MISQVPYCGFRLLAFTYVVNLVVAVLYNRVIFLSFHSSLWLCLLLLSPLISHALESDFRKSPRYTYFDIPAQPLSSALLEFALQADVEMLSPQSLVVGQRSYPIVGPFQPEAALFQLLSNTSLTFKSLSHNSWIILRDIEREEGVDVLPEERDVSSLEEVYITASRYPFRYTTISESSQLANGMSVFDSARFINVLPQQLIADQQPSDLTDLLKLTSGITPGDGLADSNDDFYIRGFARDAVYLDGFRLDSNTGIKISPINIKKVETLKGPSTLFYGQAEPGGTVNIIPKSPENEVQRSMRALSGSDGQTSFSIDLTGPLASKQDILYRVIYARESFDAQRNHIDINREWFASSLKTFFSDKTNVDIRFEVNSASSVRNQGLIVLVPDNEAIKIIAVDRGKPTRQAQKVFEAKQNFFDVKLTHFFDSGWNVQARYAHMNESRRGIRTQNNLLTLTGLLGVGGDLAPGTELRELTGTSLDGTTTIISVPVNIGTEVVSGETQSLAQVLSVYDEKGSNKTDFFRLLSGGTHTFFGMTHHLDFGVEFYRENLFEYFVLEERADIKSLLFDAVGGEIDAIDTENMLGELTGRQQTFLVDETGIYFQDSIDINDHWVLSVGARYTQTTGERLGEENTLLNEFETYEALSSQFGLVYKPKDFMSFYFNYSESMKANYQLDDVGTVIPEPEFSDQIELGAKFLLGDKLTAGVALYDIDKKNIVDVNFENGFRRSRLGGEQDIMGLDMDLSLQLARQTNIVTSFSWLNGTIGSGQNRGNMPALSAKQTASVFINHRLDFGKMKGVELNLGGHFVGDRYGDDENSILITQYAVLDAGITFRIDGVARHYDFKVDIKNITDEGYVTAMESGLRANDGARRSIAASVKLTFN